MQLPLANLLFAPENWLVIGVIALLLFGRRLPEVGKSLGKGIVEFKKGLQGIEDDVQATPTQRIAMVDQRSEPAALPAGYKYDPYTGKPVEEASSSKPPERFDPYTGKPLSEQTASST